MENLRELLEESEKKRAEKRGSIFMTILIIFVFVIGIVFYIKTAKPEFFDKAVNCIKDMAGKTMQTVSEGISQSKKQEESEQKPEGTILRSAETLDFSYLSETLVKRFETNDFCAFPVSNATVTSEFGVRTDPVTNKKGAGHHGIDLAAPKGSEIYAYDSGYVKKTGENEIYGNFILLSHNGFDSFYGHLSKVTVKEGDTVRSGDSIGIIGSSGKSTGIHLHFEIRRDETAVDPAPYLYEKI